MTRQYFVVGASTNDNNHHPLVETFIRRGYWEMDSTIKSGQPSNFPVEDSKSIARFEKMRIGDRIAIKRMNGLGSPDITILAIGIITDIDESSHRVYVNWVKPKMQKMVESHGCFARIHGPYTINESPEIRFWLNEIFRL